MRKKLMTLALVGLALVLLTGQALAAGSARNTVLAANQGPKRQAHVISMTGTITALGAQGMSVLVQMTNKPYLVKRGQTVQIKTTSTTVYYVWDGKTRKRATFSALATGQKVSINALVTTAAITARRVEVNKPRYK